jgi:hypothetical protein
MTDIRVDIEQLSDHAPFALLPVRMETLFTLVDDAQQLWVRVFPDDCWITAFDPAFTSAERTNGWAYWAQRWAAAGDEGETRAAWAALVQAHGAGRAAWIVRSYPPTQLAALPTSRDANDMALVSATDQPVSSEIATAAAAFWKRVWESGGSAAAEAAAVEELAALSFEDTEFVRAQLRPLNLTSEGPVGVDRTAINTTFTVLSFARGAERERAFSQPPSVPLFPHQLRLIGITHGKIVLDEPGEKIELPLYAGPDPTGADDKLKISSDAEGELVVGEKLSWMFDFESAVKRGLGFRVKLKPAQAAEGFDRLFVLGIHIDSAESTAKALETLLLGHRYCSEDFEFVSVGSPTNNTDGHPTQYQRTDDPNASYTTVHRTSPLQVDASQRAAKTDGQHFAEVFGLSPEVFEVSLGAERFDAAEAEAMNTALWPGTLGYFIEAMLATKGPVADAVVSDEAAANLRLFFNRHVAGRGPAPAVRIGRQPYGMITTSAFSQAKWAAVPPIVHTLPVVGLLAPVLETLRTEWRSMATNAAHLPAPEDTTASDLASVLGLQASSASIYQRYGEPAQVRSHLYRYGSDNALLGNVQAMLSLTARQMVDVLQSLGYRAGIPPELASKLFRNHAYRLRGPMAAPAPLSEQRLLPDLVPFGLNYLGMLAELALSGLEDLRLEGKNERPPDALLYLLAKFALERGYQHRANELLERSGLTRHEVASRKFEPPYVHVDEKVSNSRWRDLFSPLPALTGDNQRPLHDVVNEELRSGQRMELTEQVEALQRLSKLPTARLDRLVAEHVDLCGYRLDAWLTGLVAYQLELMRSGGDPNASDYKRGVYVGAYGWLEDVRPRPRRLTQVDITDEAVRHTFAKTLETLVSDASNGGFIAAPSLDHATTAAVLRAGYVSNAHRDEPTMLAVNLSSERVRHAQVLLEGIRNGQGLGELLGYRLERALHDRTDLPTIHTAIYALRAAFPLRAGRLAETATLPAGTPSEAIEARNVVDGQLLLEQVRRGFPTWPFGAALPSVAGPLRAAVELEIGRLEDLYDAVADLALAEGVHQLLAGNHERAAATLDAFSSGGLPPDPDVIASPRRHLGITHQIVVHLDPGAAPGSGARSIAEPALNEWLGSILPAADSVGVLVRVINPVDSLATEHLITQADLELDPLDVLMVVDPDADGLMSTLDDLLVEHALGVTPMRPDARVEVLHTQPVDGKVTFFQLAAAIADLRPMMLGSRSLRPDDLVKAVDPIGDSLSGPRPAIEPSVARSRVTVPLTQLKAARKAVEEIRARIAGDRVAAAANIDAELAAVLSACRPLDGFALSAAGRGQLLSARRDLFAATVATASALRTRMTDRITRCDLLVATADGFAPGTPANEVVTTWLEAERVISTLGTQDRVDPVAMRAAVMARRATFTSRRDDLSDIVDGSIATIGGLVTAVNDARSNNPTYPVLLGEDLNSGPLQAAIDNLVDDLIRQCTAIVAEADRKISRAEDFLLIPGNEADAARALFGDGTPIIGIFDAPIGAETQITAALAGEGSLLAHARGPLGMDDPVRDWRFGVARVRPAVWRWESVETVLDALHHRVDTELPRTLTTAALQLPHRPGAPWYAVAFPPGTVIDHDALCYTVINPSPLAAGNQWCGLVLDEWPELIPLPERTAGLAVHHDRPGSEPPQAWLAVTPAQWDGKWHWDDLVMALSDTLDLAQLRAVEPDQIDQSRYGALFPATIFPVYPLQISMTLNLALNNAAFRKFREG